jgi:hypothetical protein
MTSNNSASNGLKLQRKQGLKKFFINKSKYRNDRPKCLNLVGFGPVINSIQLYTFIVQ